MAWGSGANQSSTMVASACAPSWSKASTSGLRASARVALIAPRGRDSISVHQASARGTTSAGGDHLVDESAAQRLGRRQQIAAGAEARRLPLARR